MKTMLAHFVYPATLILLLVVLGSCSELKKDLPAPVSAQLTAHVSGWAEKTSPNFHGNALRMTTPGPWDETSCERCHAQTFQGGTSGVSCAKAGCHVDINGMPKSVQACNTCHGTFDAPDSLVASWAPPRSVDGDTLTSNRNVGAHQTHLDVLGAVVACRECHTVPTHVSDPGHIDTNPFRATVLFNGPLANLVTGHGTSVPAPSYDPAASTCGNTFCHGTWRLVKDTTKPDPYEQYLDSVMVGGGYTPLWTGGDNQAVCGSCHGIPPVGHKPFTIAQCYLCHGDVVDASGDIKDDAKHVDGKIQVFTIEYPFR